jgi:hypothetical protein
MTCVNVKLPNELIGIILKLKYFNFRKEWLAQNLEFPKLEYSGREYETTYYIWYVDTIQEFTTIKMYHTSGSRRSVYMIYMWHIENGKEYTFYNSFSDEDSSDSFSDD